MASNTTNLNLYKKDPIADKDQTFNITTMMNENWDKIDQNAGQTATQLAQIEEEARFKGVRVKLNATKNISNVTQFLVPWDSEVYDTDNFFSVANPTKIIIPAGVSRVQLKANVSISANATGIRQISVKKNGNFFPGTLYINTLAMPAGLISSINAVSAVVDVVAGDEFTLQVYQDSGTTLTLQATDWTWFELVVIE